MPKILPLFECLRCYCALGRGRLHPPSVGALRKKKEEEKEEEERLERKGEARGTCIVYLGSFGTLLPRCFRVFRRDTLIVFGEPSPRARRQMKFVASFCNVSLFERERETGKAGDGGRAGEKEAENRSRGEARISRLSAT